MLIQQYYRRRGCSFFLPFFPSPRPFPFLSLSLQFPLLPYFCPVFTKLLNLGRMDPSLLTSTHRSSSMIAPCFFWTLDCAIILSVLHQEVLLFFVAELHNKTCFSPLKLLYALLSSSFDVLQLWMRIAVVKFMDISLQLEVARRDPSDRQKWN